MLFYDVFPERSESKLIPHPVLPIGTSFSLITCAASADTVTIQIFSPSFTGLHMVDCKFINVIRFSAIHTSLTKVFFDRTTP